MKKIIHKISKGLMILIALMASLQANAITLWVGESYTWDFSGSVLGLTYNMNVTVSGGNLSVTGSGLYRTITPNQYFSGNATVTAEWDYKLTYSDNLHHQKASVTISCRENPVSISPTSLTLSPGETYQLSYRHAYDNQYVSAAKPYFSGGNSSFSVSSTGLITANSPGSGYATIYSKVSSSANAPSCFVTVREVAPTGATTGDYSILADQSRELSVNVSPSNATVKSKQWYVKSGSDVVSISGNWLTGLKPGTATIYCIVNGSVRSNDATVTVTEPSLTVASKSPEDGSSAISVFANPSVTFSHAIFEGSDFKGINLSSNGIPTEGTVEISGKTISFLPAKPLMPLSNYVLTIPRGAIKNKWGSSAQTDASLSFTTADLEKATLTFSPSSGSYISSGERVKITANPTDAKIYYTLDGSVPSTTSNLYDSPIEITSDVTIRAIAVRDGYKDSDATEGNFLKSQSEIAEYYPSDNSPLFNYKYANPYLRLSGAVEKSNNFKRITLKDSKGQNVGGSPYLAYDVIVFVPDKPLENTNTYTLDVPYDALKTTNGEIFKGFDWTFSTPNMPTGIGMMGDETVYILNQEGLLQTRGMKIKSSETSGIVSIENLDKLTSFSDAIESFSSGYSHIALVDKIQSTSFHGLNYCGELGESKFSLGIPKKVKAGFQTSAIICEDNTLWMCGRNDFHQLCGNDGTHSSTFIKSADNVKDVALGNGYTLYVDTDNILWAIGRNHLGQLGDGSYTDRKEPVKVMEDVEKVFTSSSGYFSGCITTGNDLYMWGDNSKSQLGNSGDSKSNTPELILSGIDKVSLGDSHVLALSTDYKLFAWGNNTYGQIGNGNVIITKPTLFTENVMDVDAGPNTSLIMYVDGKVTGWGRKSNDNFGSGYGNAVDFAVNEGIPCSVLESTFLVPGYFEIQPDSEFAFSAVTKPLPADYDTVEWISENPEVATVEGNGVVKSGQSGKTTITARFIDRYGNIKEAKATVVCTDNPHNTGVNAISADGGWTVVANGNKLTIRNAGIGSVYSVFNTHGTLITRQTAASCSLTFEMPNPGVYIISSGNKVRKALCK